MDWSVEKSNYRKLALSQLAKIGITGVEDRIRFERCITPDDWGQEFALHQGATFSMAHNLGQMLHRRPHNRFEDLDAMYLVGGGTHPGSGLPVIFESARITSRLLLEDLQVEPQWSSESSTQNAVLRRPCDSLLVQPSEMPSPFDVTTAAFATQRKAQRKWGETPLYLRLYALGRLRHCLAERAQQLAAIHATARPHGTPTPSPLKSFRCSMLANFSRARPKKFFAPAASPTTSGPSGSAAFTSRPVASLTASFSSSLPRTIPSCSPEFRPCRLSPPATPSSGSPATADAPAPKSSRMPSKPPAWSPHSSPSSVRACEDAQHAIESGVDKVIVTGSDRTGASVLKQLSPQPVDTVMELSGCDSVFVLMDARLDRAVEALTFGNRFNGSASCMAPRRVFVANQLAADLEARLVRSFSAVRGTPFPTSTMERLDHLIREATALGARLVYDGRGDRECGPVLLTGVRPDMEIAATDIFAPVLSLMPFRYEEEALEADRLCPYALTVTIFGGESAARRIAEQVNVGCVLINDILATTADPRCAFGGRKRSGYRHDPRPRRPA